VERNRRIGGKGADGEVAKGREKGENEKKNYSSTVVEWRQTMEVA
jgi:hypothetical protein